ncbi:MAG: hypothetical protein BGO72_12405 [Burkholderiales bacterium 70-64]|nr:MAG: hypothetical protein BGO72_12405 [Burkholderiales bacterium 70-64]
MPAGRDASAAACDRAPARWRDGVPAALVVVAVHALPVAVALLGFGTPPAQDVTPPSISGVLVAEASRQLTLPAPASGKPAPQEPSTVQVRPRQKPKPKLRPLPPVPVPPSERSITLPASAEETAPGRETAPAEAVAEAPPSPPPASPPGAQGPSAVDAPAHSGGDAAPPMTPPLADAAYLRNPAPVYPPGARRRREEGLVLLEVFIRADGSAGEARVKRSSGYPALDQSALEAVQRWNFVPARRGGEAIPYLYELPVRFSLKR